MSEERPKKKRKKKAAAESDDERRMRARSLAYGASHDSLQMTDDTDGF